jgi:hypothetical protein
MKALTNFLRLFSLFILLSIFQACSNDDEPGGGNNGPDEELSLSNIVGRWGISSSSVVGGANETLVPCKNTLEIQENGDFLYVEADAGEWQEGRATFNNSDSTLTVTFDGQTETFKLLSVSETGFELEFTENDGSNIVVGSDEYVLLDNSDCSSVESNEITEKWSVEEIDFKEYEIEDEDDFGTLTDTQVFEDVPYNKFTMEFKSDGSFIMIDLIFEYDFGLGTFENLDDHNYLIAFDDEDGQDRTLAHVSSRTSETVTLMMVDYNDSRRVVTELTIRVNDGSEPTISESDINGKWSASSVIERVFVDDNLDSEDVLIDIPHNKLTLDFDVSSDKAQLIDLVQEIGYVQGDFFLLDGSNLVIDFGGEEGQEGDEENFELFHVISSDDHQLSLINFENGRQDGEGGSGGEANNGDGEMEFDRREFEVSLNKNTGEEPGIAKEELIAEWTLLEVENLDPNSEDGEGPMVGMVITFNDDGSGVVNLDGAEVTSFEFDMIDMSNIVLAFDEGGEGGVMNNGDDEENQNEYSLFHIIEAGSETLELIIYEPSRGNGGEGEGEGEEKGGRAVQRIVMERTG